MNDQRMDVASKGGWGGVEGVAERRPTKLGQHDAHSAPAKRERGENGGESAGKTDK